MTTEEMLKLWVDITGVNPEENKTTWNIRLDGRLSEWDIKKMNDRLMEVVKYDVDGVFTKIFLRNYFNQFLKGKSATFFEYLADKEAYMSFLSECEKLKSALDKENGQEKIIIDETNQAMSFYGMGQVDISIFDIVDIKTSANVNIDNLNVVQFKKGIRSNQKPKYTRDVYMVNNINMLIRTIEKQAFDCISVNFIYDSDEPASSYFTFVIKNGDNIFLLNDRPSYTHPNQKHMTRTKGRHMEDRIDKTFFPYSLTDLRIGKYNVENNAPEVISEVGYVKLGSIADMDIYEALWIINMFSLIQKKFFEEIYECNELSYVGDMIQHSLLEQNSNDLIVYDSFEKLFLPMIDNPSELKLKYEYESLGMFKDTIERLKNRVDLDLVNSISYSDEKLLEDKTNSLSFINKPSKLLSLNINDYGTKDEIEYRQKWIARYNFAKQINVLAKKEYDASIEKVKEWYVNAAWKNIDNIFDMIIYDKLKGESITYRTIGLITTRRTNSIVKKFTIEEYRENRFWRGNRFNQSFSDDRCCFTGKKAGVAICIFPNNIDDIMLLTGCKEDEIPVVLKGWTQNEKRHFGNCILDNIDPCDWVIKDHWYQFSGQIDILLSKTAYNNLYKERGLESDKFWLNTKRA